MRYIGCKTLLLDNIESVISENVKDADSFCDIFSGTATVARYFKSKYKIISNDLLEFSYALQKATIENNFIPSFEGISKYGDPIDYFNSLTIEQLEKMPQKERFFQNNYSPTGGRMYMTDINALRIDYARTTVRKWHNKNLIDDNEYYYLVACIVEGIPFISNISGTYGAYHKTWDKRTQKKYELLKLPVINNSKKNECYNEDGVKLLKRISGDIIYIDPPYNERQYLPNYHVLETAACYDNPSLRGKTGQREYEGKKSDFCIKNKVIASFEELINNAKFKHIILSYSSDGLMSVKDIETILKKYGIISTYKMYKIPYRRYKSRMQKTKNELEELLFYIKKK